MIAKIHETENLRWVAANSSVIGDCRDGHIAKDDGLRGTLCGRVHGGDTSFVPARPCGNCLRIARARHAAALAELVDCSDGE